MWKTYGWKESYEKKFGEKDPSKQVINKKKKVKRPKAEEWRVNEKDPSKQIWKPKQAQDEKMKASNN